MLMVQWRLCVSSNLKAFDWDKGFINLHIYVMPLDITPHLYLLISYPHHYWRSILRLCVIMHIDIICITSYRKSFLLVVTDVICVICKISRYSVFMILRVYDSYVIIIVHCLPQWGQYVPHSFWNTGGSNVGVCLCARVCVCVCGIVCRILNDFCFFLWPHRIRKKF
jgi:hypothetical protein